MQSGTWRYGLIARWWAEFNVAEPHELEFYRAAIKKFGEPVLDVGCGTGRLLVPLAQEGFDIDGVDVSADMIAHARELAGRNGLKPRLTVQPMHELDVDRMYRTIYVCGAFGIGGSDDRDQEALRRAHRHLVAEEAGTLIEHLHPLAETVRMLQDAGFVDVAVTGNYTDRPPTPEDEMLTFTAIKL